MDKILEMQINLVKQYLKIMNKKEEIKKILREESYHKNIELLLALSTIREQNENNEQLKEILIEIKGDLVYKKLHDLVEIELARKTIIDYNKKIMEFMENNNLTIEKSIELLENIKKAYLYLQID